MADIEVFRARNTTGLAINGTRVTNTKPYGLIQTIQLFKCKDENIIEALGTDVQPVDIKEILRHLDSLMICVGNAYDTSHGLLQSDMEFIEKQEKIIKGLLSNETIKG